MTVKMLSLEWQTQLMPDASSTRGHLVQSCFWEKALSMTLEWGQMSNVKHKLEA